MDGCTMVSLAPVQIYKDNWKCVSEFDGLIVNISRNKINLII